MIFENIIFKTSRFHNLPIGHDAFLISKVTNIEKSGYILLSLVQKYVLKVHIYDGKFIS